MKYKNAPIREAIFDIRVTGLSVTDLPKLEELHDFFLKEYPEKKKNIKIDGSIEIIDDKVKSPFNSNLNGYVFKSSDEKQLVQTRLDGFTFNLVNHYSDWAKFSLEALRLWKIYKTNLPNIKIERIAVRYINRILIPMPFEKFQDYIINMPPIPQCLPQSYSNFFMRIEVPCNKDGTVVILSETIEKPANNHLPFILDIDVYKMGNISADEEVLLKEFEDLRNIKNSTFENCITDKTREMFN